jgi:FkbM family methyltransferase
MTIYDRDNYILAESSLKKDLLKLFKSSDKLTILDIGGCEGEESIRYARIFPFASIYVFEPLPSNQKLIEQNIVKYKAANVKLIPFAVSDEEGVSQFFVSSGQPENLPGDLDWNFGNKSSSLLLPETDNLAPWLAFDNNIEVQTVTINSFFEQNDIHEVDFIHMDVQGAELKVLRGAEDFLKKIKAIWLEVTDIELYKNQPLRVDVESFMKSNNFYLVRSDVEGNSGDQFYVNKKYFKIITFFSKFICFKK